MNATKIRRNGLEMFKGALISVGLVIAMSFILSELNIITELSLTGSILGSLLYLINIGAWLGFGLILIAKMNKNKEIQKSHVSVFSMFILVIAKLSIIFGPLYLISLFDKKLMVSVIFSFMLCLMLGSMSAVVRLKRN